MCTHTRREKRNMAWKLDSDRPIYVQLVDKIQMQIISGHYLPGGKLPSVRELAAEAAVNPNTMQKAFAELERSGLILTQRTNGRTVTEDAKMIKDIREELAKNQIIVFLENMKKLGFTQEEIISIIENNIKS